MSFNSKEEYRKFCDAFCSEGKINNVESQKYLRSYISVFEEESKIFQDGIFVIEPAGIFRPIQEARYEVVCFAKVPFSRQRVYCLYDGHRTAYAEMKNFFLIFPYITKTPHGYKFLNDVNSLYPISATIPMKEIEFYTLRTETSTVSTMSDSESNFGDDGEAERFFMELEEENRKKQILAMFESDDE
jgi:hypothetical protein